ncbi:MAG: hypothetical protein AABM29_09195 [Actinomycetota bacterium]
MIRQAQSYLAGAASSAALIAAAITTFVLLASFSAFRDWPMPNLRGSDRGAATVTGGAPADAAAGALAPAPDFVAASAPVGPPLTAAGVGGGAAFIGGALPPRGGDEQTAPGGPNVPLPGPGATSIGPGNFTPAPQLPPAPPTSGQVAGTLNNTVNQVDHALGGALSQLGVSQTVNSATNGLLGSG